ncbi:MAG: class I SAM-dependent methyltransferase [Melioribacteraceae bacterium]|nr:class I SAM-dependent methyltransferase [Melioribacteraceae bacterium]
MNNFWNERYSQKEYVYGTKPNEFFRKSLIQLTAGKILLPGEGEGRNAVFAAKLGWHVTAFDFSDSAMRKALALTEKENVEVNYLIENYNNFSAENDYFDCIAAIFVHPPKESRKQFHKKLLTLLKPGGKLILEGFSKNQINYNSGGPKDIDMLFSEEELLEDLKEAQKIDLLETVTELNEGLFHKGHASTIQLIAIK